VARRLAMLIAIVTLLSLGSSGTATAGGQTGNLVFTVTDAATGSPGSGLCVDTYNSPTSLSGCSDAAGQLRFRRIPVGTYWFYTREAPGYLYYGPIDNVVVERRQTTTVPVQLTRPAVAEMTMTDAATGDPVPNACVHYSLEADRNTGNPDVHQCSDGQGRLVLSSYPLRFRLFVTPRDGIHGSQWVGPTGGTGDVHAAQWFQTTAGQTIQIAVRLDPAGTITGTVTDANGAGIERACSWVTAQPSWQIVPFCSGSTGRYLIENVGPYQWKLHFADYSGQHAWQWSGNTATSATATPVTVTAGQTTTVDATLPAAGRITGRVVGATVPWQYVTVYAVSTVTGEIASPFAFMRPDYTFELGGLATQSVRLVVSASHAGEHTHPDTLDVVQGQTLTGVTLTVPG
jgi:hypothetical protein